MKTRISILQGICASLILMAYFLPWIQISFLDKGASFSVVDAVMKLTGMVSDAADMSNSLFKIDLSEVRNYSFLLYLVLIAAFVNVIVQWLRNSPRTAFYFNLIPFSLCVAMIVAAVKYDINIFEVTGIGFAMALFASTISLFVAWTVIGRNYDSRYQCYMKVLSYCVLASVIMYIIIKLILERHFGDMIDSEGDIKAMANIAAVCGLFMLFFMLHLPFLVYGWIVVMVASTEEDKSLNTKEELTEAIDTAQKEFQRHLCPQCGRMMDDGWKVCPYCGHSPEEEKMREQENDNLRYAPPGYKKDL